MTARRPDERGATAGSSRHRLEHLPCRRDVADLRRTAPRRAAASARGDLSGQPRAASTDDLPLPQRGHDLGERSRRAPPRPRPVVALDRPARPRRPHARVDARLRERRGLHRRLPVPAARRANGVAPGARHPRSGRGRRGQPLAGCAAGRHRGADRDRRAGRIGGALPGSRRAPPRGGVHAHERGSASSHLRVGAARGAIRVSAVAVARARRPVARRGPPGRPIRRAGRLDRCATDRAPLRAPVSDPAR